jgi:hypothetical protein
MREAIGGTWIFSIVIVFIVLFSSYLAISVNYSKAFKVKNSIVSIIEQKEGLSTEAQEEIKSYLSGIGYVVYGSCSEDEKGYESNVASTGYMYCISKSTSEGSSLQKTYYKVKVFFRLDLPIFGNLFTFPVTGETKAVYFANDN